jgi:cysteine-S-conjugate beta-lyase
LNDRVIRDLTDDEARVGMPLKWGSTEDGVIPAWVAEMDYAIAPPISEALHEAVARGVTGYPPFDLHGGELSEAYAAFAERHYGETVDPGLVLPTVDVTAGVRLALDVLSEPGPMVLPLPAYHPQLGIPAICGRERWDIPVPPDVERAMFDLDHLDRLLADGATTLLLTNPHNPCGHVHTREELEGIRDVVRRHGARVISDEVHAPLVMPGAKHIPYLSLEGTADHAVAVVASSKAFNTQGLKFAQIVSAEPKTHQRLVEVPLAQNDSWSSLGVVAALAAYRHGDPWLAALIDRLTEIRALLADLLAEHMPEARMRPLEATYLAWLDLRAYGHEDPAAVALSGGVRTSPGHDFHPGLPGHIRLNLATSRERLTEIVRRLGAALA